MAKKINPMLAIAGGLIAVLLLFAIISIVFYPGQAVVVDDPHGGGHGVEGDHSADHVDHGSEGDHGAEEDGAGDVNDSDTKVDDDTSSTDDNAAANDTDSITAAVGDTVFAHYVGKFENGTVFASTNRETGAQPIEFILGKGVIVKGFDDAVLGMKKGETKTTVVQPKDGFPSNPDLIITFNRAQIEGAFGSVPEIGNELTFSNGNLVSKGVVREVTSNTVVIDFNSNTVGKVLTYEITVIDISRN